MLKIVRTNKFGNHCYIEDSNGTVSSESLNNKTIWTIENPSEKLIQLSHVANAINSGEQIIKKYNGVTFLTTKFASEKFPSGSGNGAACIVRYTDANDRIWFILVSDNKKYVQNCAGSADFKNSDLGEESPLENILRELGEELQLFPNPARIVSLGSWAFRNVNEIINLDTDATTTLFLLDVVENDIKHILPANLSEFCIVNSKHLNLEKELDEVEYLYFVPQDKLDDIPEKVNSENPKDFNGHHRGILRIVSGLENNCSYPYLSKFNVKL